MPGQCEHPGLYARSGTVLRNLRVRDSTNLSDGAAGHSDNSGTITAMTKEHRATRVDPQVSPHGLAAVSGIAIPVGLWHIAPVAALILLLIEATVTMIIMLAALFGPEHVSQRAFRILDS